MLAELVIPPEDPEPEETAPVATIIWNMKKVEDQAFKHWEKEWGREKTLLAQLEQNAKAATDALENHQSMMKINADWRQEAKITIQERISSMKSLEDGLKPATSIAPQSAASSLMPVGNSLSVPDTLVPKLAALSATSATKEQVLAAVQSLQTSQPPDVMSALTMLMDMSYEMTQHCIQSSQQAAMANAADGLQVAEGGPGGQDSGQLIAGQNLEPAGNGPDRTEPIPAAELSVPMAIDPQEKERLEAEAKRQRIVKDPEEAPDNAKA